MKTHFTISSYELAQAISRHMRSKTGLIANSISVEDAGAALIAFFTYDEEARVTISMAGREVVQPPDPE